MPQPGAKGKDFYDSDDDDPGVLAIRLRQRQKQQADELQSLAVMEAAIDGSIGSSGCLRRFVDSSAFQNTVQVLVLLNAALMMAEHHRQPPVLDDIATYGSYAFTALFTMEALLKIAGMGFCGYWASGWNRFDFILCVVTIIGCAAEFLNMNEGLNVSGLRALRILSATRALRLLRGSTRLQELIVTTWGCIQGLYGVVLLLCVVLFMYGCAGVELFGRLGCELSPCEALGPQATFDDFPNAVLMWLRVLSGDGGAAMLRDALRVPPLCDDSVGCQTDCCASSVLASLLYMSFVIITRFVIINVLLAMMMLKFEKSAPTSI